MLFNSVTYLLFLPIVFTLYWSAKTCRGQNLILLLASMFFYGWWSFPCLGLMVGTCVLNYVFVHQILIGRGRKAWLVAALMINFGTLGVFKYFNFFADNLGLLMNTLGFHADMPTLNIILPIGISFYSFQLSAYVIDCYRGDIQPTRSFVRYLTFISFFPQLVAGPIERGSHLLPQFSYRRKFDEVAAIDGMRLILWGLVKKMLVADNCAYQVDYVFSNYDSVSSSTLWLGALYFTFQIYGDFSGYSDMAVGSARLFGIHITHNFNRPYFAISMQDFWRRWHITLMSWFRDYVYIPLGGSRKGKVRKQMNILIVFLLSGLWHGAGWTFICWGLYHALVYHVSTRWLTFLLVLFGWVIFRAPDMSVCVEYIASMFNTHSFGMPDCSRMPLLLIAMLMLTEWYMKGFAHPFMWKSTGLWSFQIVRMLIYLIVFISTIVLGGEKTQFIYFQF